MNLLEANVGVTNAQAQLPAAHQHPSTNTSATPAPATDPLITPDRLRDLQTEYGNLVDELLDLFEQTAPESLDKLHAALRAADGDAQQRAAHELKGACLNIGALAMGAACAELEHGQSDARARDTIDHLERNLPPTLVALRSAIAPASPASGRRASP